MSSFGEKKAMKFAREIPTTFLQYNQRQLSRTYPAGVRIDSSNYDPLPLWAVGCQMGNSSVI
jgi:Phosphatidylinositol-specific phospholipase C, Y domain